MTGYHLDTNVVITLMNRDPRWAAARLKQVDRLRARYQTVLARQSTIALSSITVHELEFGGVKSTSRLANANKLRTFLAGPVVCLPFDADDARAAGEVCAALAAIGKPIGPYDVLIAGQALRHGATLVTANVREFGRIDGLRLEDWTR